MTTRRIQKNLTVMFTDISGFTKHTETISRDALMSRLETHNELLMPIIAHFEGKIVKTIGDAFLITFESPTNAVQCGLFMQHTLRLYNVGKPDGEQIHIKVSINSGEVTVTENDVFGDPVNVAAKIEKATNSDEIYFTESVFLAMNKAEVPTSFVKAFRPKGAESFEIKLYKVAMDETDERYKKVIQGTKIDKEKMKTRVLELSNVAEKEFTRYQDTLEALVETQQTGSRTVVLAVIIAAVILAGAIIAGFAIFGGPKDNPEARVIDSARAFLSADKPEDARSMLLKHVQEHGSSDALKSALEDVTVYEINKGTRNAESLLNAGRADQAVVELQRVLGDREPGEAQKALLVRAKAHVAAQKALDAGDTKGVLQQTEIAAGANPYSDELKRLREQAMAIDSARVTIADAKRIRNEANAVIESLRLSFGERTEHPVVVALLMEAMKARLYWEARDKKYQGALELLDNYKGRFTGIRDWPVIAREVHLGGLWNYTTDPSMRRQWFDWYSSAWEKHYREVKAAAEADVDFQFRVGLEMFELNRAMYVVITSEKYFLEPAIEAKPELFEKNRDIILEMCRTWIDYGTEEGDFLRKLVRKHFYTDLKPLLEEGLFATYRSSGEDRPKFAKRQHCLAMLADRGDLGKITDVYGYFEENFEIFMDSPWGMTNEQDQPLSVHLTRDHVRAFFSLPMSKKDYDDCKALIERYMGEVRDRTGRFSTWGYAKVVLPLLLEDLKASQPEHANE